MTALLGAGCWVRDEKTKTALSRQEFLLLRRGLGGGLSYFGGVGGGF